MKKIAVFASGAGSNARKIVTSSSLPPSPGEKEESMTQSFNVALIVSNKADAGVLKVAADHNIPTLILDKERFFRGDSYVELLREQEINWIVLAGFLWKIPTALINAFPGRIINIHPALLPKYGGKGMYGHYVHQAVIDQKEKETGITIHFVDEIYDHGKIIFQTTCPVMPGDSPAELEKRVRILELEHYPKVIEQLINGS